MNLGARIREKRLKAKKTLDDIAKRFEISRGAVSDWENNKTRPDMDRMYELAKFLSTSTDYLLSGHVPQGMASDNVSAGPEMGDPVPLISWVRAGHWEPANDPFPVGAIEEERWVACPVRHGPNAYALRVQGDSMTALHGRSYPDGCIIFVDPALRSPASGARVIAKLEGTDEVTFKIFVNDGGKIWLKPLNPQYPPIMEPFKVLGTVLGKFEEG